MEDPPNMRLRAELSESVQQREELVDLRYNVLEVLGRYPDGLNESSLAAQTGYDVEAIREAMSDLADAQLIEINPPDETGAISPDDPTPEQTYRLLAI